MSMQDLANQFSDIYRRLAELERRARNRKRTGTVSEVDHKKGLARVRISEPGGTPYVGPWMPWKEIAAGDIKTHIPPSVGQQVTVVSESGDLTDGEIDMSIPSTGEPAPARWAGSCRDEGSVRIEVADDLATVTAPKVIVKSPSVQLGEDGGKKVARIGDMVRVTYGSSAGLHPIAEGSSRVFAAD